MDQGAIEVQPLLKIPFSDGLPDACVSVDRETGPVVGHINQDSSKISVFACDAPECVGDPFNS